VLGMLVGLVVAEAARKRPEAGRQGLAQEVDRPAVFAGADCRSAASIFEQREFVFEL